MPDVVHPALIAQCDTYREACILAWHLRRQHLRQRGDKETAKHVALACGMHPPHMTDYLGHDNDPHRRSMPARFIGPFEAAMGNTAVSQWLAMRAGLTVAEEAAFWALNP